MLAYLDTPEEGFDQWSYYDATGGVVIAVPPLLPHEPGCEPFAIASTEEEPRGDLIPGLRPCDLAPDQWPNLHDYDNFGGQGWAACESLFAGWLYVSRHPVSATEALVVVEHQFGVGLTSDEIAGHPVYLNSCADWAPECTPAIAVSVDPYLVILVPDHQDEEIMRELATELIERLKE